LNLSDASFAEVEGEIEEEDEEDDAVESPKRRRNKKTVDKLEELDEYEDISSENSEDIYDDNFIIDKLPSDRAKLVALLGQVKSKIKEYKQAYLEENSHLSRPIFILEGKSYVGDNAVPICADITKFDFENLIKKQMEIASREFDVLMMDPPWRLSTSQPSRGVAIQYSSLSDEAIEQIPVPLLQKEGFLFIWVINAKFQWTVNIM
jgi:mRNA (2'-O-methyladenosine-N6-)-methyltransferase